MPAHVIIGLDTTAPVLSLGEVDRLGDGRPFVPYQLDEPAIVSIEFPLGSTPIVNSTQIISRGLLQPGGHLDIRWFVRDDVGNELARTERLQVPPVQGRVTKRQSGNVVRDRGPDSGRIMRPQRGEVN